MAALAPATPELGRAPFPPQAHPPASDPRYVPLTEALAPIERTVGRGLRANTALALIDAALASPDPTAAHAHLSAELRLGVYRGASRVMLGAKRFDKVGTELLRTFLATGAHPLGPRFASATRHLRAAVAYGYEHGEEDANRLIGTVLRSPDQAGALDALKAALERSRDPAHPGRHLFALDGTPFSFDGNVELDAFLATPDFFLNDPKGWNRDWVGAARTGQSIDVALADLRAYRDAGLVLDESHVDALIAGGRQSPDEKLARITLRTMVEQHGEEVKVAGAALEPTSAGRLLHYLDNPEAFRLDARAIGPDMRPRPPRGE